MPTPDPKLTVTVKMGPALKQALQKFEYTLHNARRIIGTADGALHAIVNAGIHHPQCVIDNCRPSCPIRIAKQTLVMMK